MEQRKPMEIMAEIEDVAMELDRLVQEGIEISKHPLQQKLSELEKELDVARKNNNGHWL